MSYASKAQLKILAEAIKQKFAKKIDPEAISGSAQQLLASIGVTDKVPYNFRTAGGSADIGNRLNDKIVGGTINWNQLVRQYPASATINGVTFTNNGDRTITVNGTATADAAFISSTFTNTAGHIYLLYGCPSGGSATTYSLSYGGGYKEYGSGEFIPNTAAVASRAWNIQVYAGTTVSNLVFRPQFFDLTAMFGSTIADYVYSLEQATAGAGVAWFKKLFPKSCYEYNAGELMSVCTNEHITRGFNAYDHETGKAILIGGNAYQITGTYASLSYSTGETISPNTSGVFTPTENGVLTVVGGNNTDTCVHLVWSGYRNGEYEPYVEHNYPLSPVELRGIPKLDSSNNLYYDGDTYEKDGTVTRRYGIVDLGTLDWRYNSTNEIFHVPFEQAVKQSASGLPKALCTKYTASTWTAKANLNFCIVSGFSSGIHIIDTAYTDAASFKAAMSGVYLVYELVTPTTETANPFTDPQIVDDFGTEEYVDALATAETNPRDVAIPVGHETFYQANLRDKLQNLPNIPENSGQYVVSYDESTRKCSFVEYSTHRYHYQMTSSNDMITISEKSVPNLSYNDVTKIMTQVMNGNTVLISSYDNRIQGTFTGRDEKYVESVQNLVLVLFWGADSIVTYSITQTGTEPAISVKTL